MSKLKIIVIGPEEAGKTLISNIISDMSDNDFSQYEPTEGVRILEFETSVKTDSSRNINAEVELWDCAGSQRFQSCWPIVQLDAQGVIFVHNPQNPQQLSELELLYDYFVIQGGLNDVNCMVFVNQRSSKAADTSNILPQRFRKMSCKTINAASNPNGVKSQFSNFVEGLWNELKNRNAKRT